MTHRLNLEHAADVALARMLAVYGREFTTRYEAMSHDELRRALLNEVGYLPDALDRMAWASAHLPARCVTLTGYRDLCLEAKLRPAQFDAMQADDSVVRNPTRDELAALRAVRDATQLQRPGREWAHRILRRHAAGEAVSGYSLKLARAALADPVSRETENDAQQLPPFPEIDHAQA